MINTSVLSLQLNGEKPLSNCEILARYIASSIDLQWELSPTETPGKALLDSLPFPTQIHHLITMPPIHWGKYHMIYTYIHMIYT